MERIRLAVAVAFLAVAGCDLGGATGLGSMSFKVDSKDWAALPGTTVATVPAGLNSITISGANNGTTEPVNSVTIQLNGNAAGTYTLDSSKNTIALANASKTYKNKDVGGGKVEITKFDPSTVEGTFEVIAETSDKTSTITVTAGKFSAPRR